MPKTNAQNYGGHALSPSVATRLPPRTTRRHMASGPHCRYPRAHGCFREVVHAARFTPPPSRRSRPARGSRVRACWPERAGARAGEAGPRHSQIVPAPAPRRSVVAVATRERQRRRRASPAPPPGCSAVGSGRPARAVPASWPALAGRSERPPVRGSRLPSGRAQLAGATMLRWSCRRGASTGTRLPGRPGRPAHHRRH